MLKPLDPICIICKSCLPVSNWIQYGLYSRAQEKHWTEKELVKLHSHPHVPVLGSEGRASHTGLTLS